MRNYILFIAISVFSLGSFSQTSNWSFFSNTETSNFVRQKHISKSNLRDKHSCTILNTPSYTRNVSTNKSTRYNDVYEEDYGCYPMERSRFNNALNSIRSKSFSDIQLRIAKRIVSYNCLSVRQLKRIAQIFDFEDTKLEFAKFSYTYCYDPGNYWKINDIFTFESTMEELDEYIYGW